MKLHQCCLLLCGLFLAGCARVSTMTTIHPDGSYARKVVFTVSKASVGPSGPGTSAKEKPEDFFRLPGADYKIVRTEDKNSLIVTATREVGAGAQPVEDVAVWGDKKQLLATSSAMVTKLPDGRIEYVETLRRIAPPKDQQFAIPELRALIKKALPAAFQQTETIDNVTREVALNYFHALFGPPEPLLFSFFTNPEAGVRKLNATAFVQNVQSLQRLLPGVDEAKAQEIARDMARVITDPLLNQAGESAEPKQTQSSSSDGDMTPLTFAVSFPGKVVETNGLLDPMTGEVYWSLLPVSLDAGEVKLRLVIQP